MLKICRFLIIFLSITMAAPAFFHAEDLQEAVEDDDGFGFDVQIYYDFLKLFTVYRLQAHL